MRVISSQLACLWLMAKRRPIEGTEAGKTYWSAGCGHGEDGMFAGDP